MSVSRTGNKAAREKKKPEPGAEKAQPQPDLRILEAQVLRGPNFWSYDPAIRLLVDLGSLEQWPTNTIPAFNNALLDMLPGLEQHGIVGLEIY